MFIVQIAGHLGRDPETRFTPSGQKVTSFTIATNQRKGKEDVTIWVRVTIWGDRLDKLISYLKKGSAVIVIGKMNPPTTYVDKEGRTQIALEVTAEMVEFSPFGKGDRPEGQAASQGYASSFNEQQSGAASSNQYEESHSQQGSNYARNTPYGSTTSTGQSQGTQHSGGSEDETLPF